MSIITASNIEKSYLRRERKIDVLCGIDFSADEGEVVVIYGVSGAGKSTLLHILGTLDLPTAGELQVCGMMPLESSGRELNDIRNRYFGFVFQFHYLLQEFSALENVMMPGMLSRDSEDGTEERAHQLLEEVGMSHRATHRPAELSGGEKQRVAVARALMNEPAIVLADEPSGNLDDRNSDLLHALIMRLSREKKQTFIIVTHEKRLIREADRSLVLEDGLLIERS
ncbi:MAG: ATP-binding cassette domain-containing protein [Candidatus Latescibacteria bacterium]|nr:ATP-binding cassette domain-containing protein [bacterium]MBD3423674.1 ATP-binding cassette domain-containing protein [Candidatus Latescibacterota bacterium]